VITRADCRSPRWRYGGAVRGRSRGRARIGDVPESAEQQAERKRRAREAARRREAVNVLRITECTCRYGASQLHDGLGPEEARMVALEVAAELTAAAESLVRLTRLGVSERKLLAKQLAALGVPTRQIAAQLGVCDRAVRYYLSGRTYAARLADAGRSSAAVGATPPTVNLRIVLLIAGMPTANLPRIRIAVESEANA
jgi:hypothetical protein